MASKHRVLAGVVAAVVLSGCAGMSEDECAVTDWQTVGFEDGARGYSSDQVARYRKACSKHGVAPDLQAYQAGRAKGLVEFCQPDNGFNVGASGRRYNGVCGSDVAPEFLDAYRDGRQLHDLQSRVNGTNSQIYAKERQLKATKKKLLSKEAELISDGIPTQDRVIILAEVRDLSEQRGQLESEIDRLLYDKGHQQAELDAYQASLAY